MNYLVHASTDVGITKATNQDSLCIKVININGEKIVFAALCDGMGGLSKGELASATMINALCEWAENELPKLYASGQLCDHILRARWEQIIAEESQKIMDYGNREGIRLGTTVCAILLTNDRYYVLNVGDSRVYEVQDSINLITKDQTLVQRELDEGILTPDEALTDPRRSILLQCVGASGSVYPDMFFGDTKCNAVYFLCSDGFRHEITDDEIFGAFNPQALTDTDSMKQNAEYLIELNKQRKETDNISVALIRTF
ncbi:MAG: serine/threonine-protein phosphatase [Clostridiales bacterium]|nr:serine/threonine-protein phosphatase [Clostridiales bacterium]